MPSTQRAGIPYPAATDAPTAAADMQAMAEALDPNLVLHAADAADRDARYLSPIPGMVVAGDDGTVWIADQLGDWHTVYQPLPAWANLSMSGGMNSEGAQARLLGKQVHLRGNVTASDGAIENGATLAFVPAGMEPATGGGRFFSVGCSLSGAADAGTVRIQVNSSGSITTAHQYDPAPPFIALDGCTYWID